MYLDYVRWLACSSLFYLLLLCFISVVVLFGFIISDGALTMNARNKPGFVQNIGLAVVARRRSRVVMYRRTHFV